MCWLGPPRGGQAGRRPTSARTSSRGPDRLGWSWDKCFRRAGEKPRVSRLGNAELHTGTTRTKAFLWAHSFNLQQEAIRKNN